MQKWWGAQITPQMQTFDVVLYVCGSCTLPLELWCGKIQKQSCDNVKYVKWWPGVQVQVLVSACLLISDKQTRDLHIRWTCRQIDFLTSIGSVTQWSAYHSYMIRVSPCEDKVIWLNTLCSDAEVLVESQLIQILHERYLFCVFFSFPISLLSLFLWSKKYRKEK